MTAWEFTEADGLPLSTPVLTGNNLKHFIALAPLAPGKVCLAGSFGQTWLATATFAPPGKKSVRVFHESREAFDRDSQEQPRGVDVAFHPTFMLNLLDPSNAGPEPAAGLIVGRGELMAEYPPLRIAPTTLSVSAVATGAQLNMYMPSSWPRSDVHRGALYFVGVGPGSLPTLRRYALPELKAEPALVDCPTGFVAFTGDRLHIIGRDWWTGHADGKPLWRVAEALPWWFSSGFFMRGRPPEPPETPEVPRLLAIYHSNHYGLLVKRGWSSLHEEAMYDVSPLLNAAATQSSTENQPASLEKSQESSGLHGRTR